MKLSRIRFRCRGMTDVRVGMLDPDFISHFISCFISDFIFSQGSALEVHHGSGTLRFAVSILGFEVEMVVRK